ncbi:MAG TPA: hypothetical protein VGF55_21760 [Gemmataceae bacterium]
MASERPSPFTIPEPVYVFSEGPATEPLPIRPLAFRLLIQNLRAFADFYEQMTRQIEAARGVEKPYFIGGRDANADDLRKKFMAVQDIDRIRALTLSRYAEELTIGSAQRLLGELLQTGDALLTMDQAMGMTLGEVADRMEGKSKRGVDPPLAKSRSKAKSGPRRQNDDLFEYESRELKKNPHLSDKEILAGFKKKHSDHPIFQATDPRAALRAARARRNKKLKGG